MKNIEGLILQPSTLGSCSVNIRKAFQVLRSRMNVDSILLTQEDKLYQGNKSYII